MPPEVHREIRRLLMLKAGTEKLASRMRTVNVMSRIEIVEQLMRGRTKGARQVQGRHGSEAPDRCVQDAFLNRAMTEVDSRWNNKANIWTKSSAPLQAMLRFVD